VLRFDAHLGRQHQVQGFFAHSLAIGNGLQE
jgi:hypothetical protein